MQWFVYILRCADGTFYAGSTNNIEKRVYAHNNLKSGAHYTKIRRPVTLVYRESLQDLSAARRRENELKKLSRKQKMTLFPQSE